MGVVPNTQSHQAVLDVAFGFEMVLRSIPSGDVVFPVPVLAVRHGFTEYQVRRDGECYLAYGGQYRFRAGESHFQVMPDKE